MTLSRRGLLAGGAFASLFLAAPTVLRAQTKSLKVSHHLPPMHQIHVELTRWADELRATSSGALDLQVFPSSQMGPPPRQADLVRTGVADIAFVYTAMNPGRFPVNDLFAAPLVVSDEDGKPIPSADASWIASKMKTDLQPEFAGAELLYSVLTTNTGFFMRTVDVQSPADLRGLRLRPTSPNVGQQLEAMGASNAMVPPAELADAIAKGVVDGATFNFEGGRAFQLHQAVKKVSMVCLGAGIFGLAMNQKSLAALPAELQQLIQDTTGPEAGRRVGGLYDKAEAEGRAFMEANGVEVRDLEPAQAKAFYEAVAPVRAAQIAALTAAGKDADGLLAQIKQLRTEV